ncbi:MAG: CBS domain-containing protein [Clostridiales bacterium]|nr:CBS domain-containing protein [Clostridiales bacterium]
MSSNASKFIEAYNIIDRTLRTQYGYKDSLSFSELLRQTAPKNQLVKKYADELYDFGRLRNAIVHKSTDKIIAQPNDEAVELITHIARLLTSPPLAIDVVKKRQIIAFDDDQNVSDLIEAISKHNYSNIPIYQGDRVAGIVNSKQILNVLVKILQTKKILNYEDLKKIKLSQIAHIDYEEYVFMPTSASIIDVLTVYAQNPRLKAVLLTRHGDNTLPVLAVVTSSDWLTFSNILDKI